MAFDALREGGGDGGRDVGFAVCDCSVGEDVAEGGFGGEGSGGAEGAGLEDCGVAEDAKDGSEESDGFYESRHFRREGMDGLGLLD